MAVSRGMRRLRQVLELQEEQYRSALDAALVELKELEVALKATGQQERDGRKLVRASAGTGEFLDRVAGLEESRMAARRAASLKPKIAETEAGVNARRGAFLEKRIERRKAETLIQRVEAEDAVDAGRRSQRDVDDWFLRKLRQE